jgi:hypothetical protein
VSLRFVTQIATDTLSKRVISHSKNQPACFNLQICGSNTDFCAIHGDCRACHRLLLSRRQPNN